MTHIVDQSFFYIYTITNRVTGGVYVGQTKNAQDRWTQHLRDLRKGTHFNPRLQHSFTKHGEEEFSYTVLAYYATVAECCAAESAEIARYQAAGCSYNLKTEVTLFGGLMTQEVRERMSRAHRGEANYQYGRRGPANPRYGHKHSEQTRELMSTCKRGAKNPMWGKPGTRLGATLSAAVRAKISAARTGQKWPAERRAARRAATEPKA